MPNNNNVTPGFVEDEVLRTHSPDWVQYYVLRRLDSRAGCLKDYGTQL